VTSWPVRSILGAALGLAIVAAPAELRAGAAPPAPPAEEIDLMLFCWGAEPLHGIADFVLGARQASLSCDGAERSARTTLASDGHEAWQVALKLTTPDAGLTCAEGGARLPASLSCTLGFQWITIRAAYGLPHRLAGL
jgi:hypothetical protein